MWMYVAGWFPSRGLTPMGHAETPQQLNSLTSHISCVERQWVLDGDQAQVDMEANHKEQEEVEAQVKDAHGGQSPP